VNPVLIVEDEDRIAAFVAKGLKASGYSTLRAATLEEGLDLARTHDPALIILDLGLPDGDGMDLLEVLRGEGSPVPVIVLTARVSIDDTVAVLEGGADDYMSKPFRFEELLARVRLRLRGAEAPSPASAREPDELVFGELRLRPGARTASVAGREVALSTREFDLAMAFARNEGQVLTREQLLSRVWGFDFDPGSNVVDVYVRYLRNKLGADRFSTVRGVGYRFEGR